MTGPAIRKACSAKARKSTSGTRKKGKTKMQQHNTHHFEQDNTNFDILVPKSKDKERKEQLMQELTSQSESKWTSKKKKRLEKYIEKKIKKEDRLVLFEKLTQSQASISSNILRASSTLGTNKDSVVIKIGRKRKRDEDSFDSECDNDTLSDIGINDEPKLIESSVDGSPTLEKPFQMHDTLGGNADHRVYRKTAQKKSARGWAKRDVPEIDDGASTSFDSSDSGDDEITRQGTHDIDDSNGQDAHLDSQMEKRREKSPSIPGKRSSGFKDWALQQLRKVKRKDCDTTDQTFEAESLPLVHKERITDDLEGGRVLRGPLGETLEMPSTSFAQRVMDSSKNGSSYVKVVEVKRPPEVQNARILLPIITEEQVIMETILLNPVVIICGETGSGKTTQVPQFLYEAGFGTPGSENPGMIGITQPRRVAAVAMAERVGHELSLNSARVSYQIRYDATVSQNTSIKFMTDGVLLRELAIDFLLAKYSVVVIDEAHERNINTDILIGVLSRVIKLREDLWKQGKNDIKPLRLIIMSATLRISDFSENRKLFPTPPPVINIAARQHPVTIHFSRRTHSDYITQAIKKTVQIHRQLPPGGILVFLTGQSDIVGVCKKLKAKFGRNIMNERRGKHLGVSDTMDGISSLRSVAVAQAPLEVEDLELHDDGITDSDEHLDEEGDESQEDGDSDQELDAGLDAPMHIVPLYSLLPSEKQLRVFEPPPPNCRLVVISTNIAETSLTIPGIRYVVDCGRVKERRYDATSGVQSFHISWISKASSAQRAGRAGRTGPGHCYRLYSSAFYEHHFASFSMPEIQRMPIEGVVLQMKSMGIDAAVNFPFPTPPDRQALHKAEKILTFLGALRSLDSKNGAKITELGHAMSLFPLSPRFSRMLVTSQQHGCLPYIICIVSALAVGNPFTPLEVLADGDSEAEESSAELKGDTGREKEARRQLRKAFYDTQRIHAALGNYTSDLFKYLSVIGAYEYAGGALEFCKENFVQPKLMKEIHNLRAQISNIVAAAFPGAEAGRGIRLAPPNDRQLNALRQVLTAGFLDQVAVRKDIVEKQRSGTRFTTPRGIPYRALGVSEDVFLHPSSILIDSPPPAYLVFNEVVRTSRIYLKGLTVVNPAWLSTLGKDTLCSFSKPVKNNVGTLMTVPTFGPDRWELPAIKVGLT